MKLLTAVAVVALLGTPARAQDVAHAVWGNAMDKAATMQPKEALSYKADVACDMLMATQKDMKGFDARLQAVLSKLTKGIDNNDMRAFEQAGELLGTMFNEERETGIKRGYSAAYCEIYMAEEEKASK